MLIASMSRFTIDKLKDLSSEFKMKDVGEAKVLGMEIERERKGGKVSLTQKGYLKKFKLKANMSPTSVEEHEYITHVPYASAVGSLIYAVVCTRPGLLQVVSIVSRYIHDPSWGHWEAVKWILWYIKSTIDVSLVFEKDSTGKQECVRYVDFDYTGDLDKCRSTTGYVFTLSQAPVSWHSILQSTIALSTAEAEYMVMMEAMKETI